MVFILLVIFAFVVAAAFAFSALRMASPDRLSAHARFADDIEQMRALRPGRAPTEEGRYAWSDVRTAREGASMS